jgi:hypothetical protein
MLDCGAVVDIVGCYGVFPESGVNKIGQMCCNILQLGTRDLADLYLSD